MFVLLFIPGIEKTLYLNLNILNFRKLNIFVKDKSIKRSVIIYFETFISLSIVFIILLSIQPLSLLSNDLIFKGIKSSRNLNVREITHI